MNIHENDQTKMTWVEYEQMTWSEYEQFRQNKIKELIDLKKIKELVEKIPFEITDWKKGSKQFGNLTLSKEDETVMDLLFPYLRALVVINYLEATFTKSDDHDLKYAVSNDFVFASYNVLVLKGVLQDILNMTEVYDVVGDLLLKDDASEKNIWDYYDSVIKNNPDFIELRELIKNAYDEHKTKIYVNTISQP